MGEDRLIEITSAISRLDGPLWIMGYVASLKDSEVYLFLKYVGSSKYRDMNLCDAISAFSHDYLKSKNILLDLPLSEELEKNVEDESLANAESLYINELFSNCNHMSVGHSGRK